MRKLANDNGVARLPRHSLNDTVSGYVGAILEGLEEW